MERTIHGKKTEILFYLFWGFCLGVSLTALLWLYTGLRAHEEAPDDLWESGEIGSTVKNAPDIP